MTFDGKANIIVCSHEPEAIQELIISSTTLIPHFENLGKDIGDYFIGDWILERKAAGDFCSSIKDGRLFNTALTFSRMPSELKCGFIVEGSFYPHIKKHRITQEVVDGTLNSLEMDYHCYIFRTSSKKRTVTLLEKLVVRNETPPDLSVMRNKIPKMSLSEQQEFVLMGLPGVGKEKAKAFLLERGSLLEAFNYFPNTYKGTESAIIKGKTEAKIWELLIHPYGSEAQQ